MKKLTVIMADDWNIYSKFSHEYDILCKSYAMGKKVTIAYAGKIQIINRIVYTQIYMVIYTNI